MNRSNTDGHKKKGHGRALFFAFLPFITLLSELLIVIIALFVMKGAGADTNMLAPLPVAVLGLLLCIVYALAERVSSSRRDMKWWQYPVFCYVIPLVILGILTAVNAAAWKGREEQEDAVLLKWILLSMLIYLAAAFAFRVIFGLVRATKESLIGGKKK